MPEPDPDAVKPRRTALDGLAGVAGLLGGALLLFRRPRRPVAHRHNLGKAAASVALTDGSLQGRGPRSGRGRPSTPPTLAAERLGHEPGDANAGKVAVVMTGLAITVVGAVVVLFLLLNLFHAQLQASRPTLTGQQQARLEPPKPNLESDPEADLHEQRAGEDATLNGYGWRDAGHEVAHVPIDRAMALAVGRPLDASP